MSDRSERQRGRAERLDAILARDGSTCVWCGRAIGTRLVRATTEHVVPRLKGGPSWLENELAACPRCNADRGHRSPSVWLEECEQLGRAPNRAAVVASLERLQAAIAERGGQRRARHYVAAQLRRLR